MWRGCPDGHVAVRRGLLASLADARDRARSAEERDILAAIVERVGLAVRRAYGLPDDE